ncbi:MAG TPA: response regulator transcription factor [Anaerolineales bacterium]
MSSSRILVVEDEPSIAEVTSLYLKRAGFQVVVATDGEEALDALGRQFPDLIVLDLMLPGMDGMEITRHVRAMSDVPIIMLTARREEADRIAGLETGADDYVVKPFSPQELVSRVRAVLRRSQGQSQVSNERPLVFGDLVIDPQTRLVTVQGVEVLLTVKEFDMLWLLARHPRQVFSRRQLLERVWGLSDYIDPGTVTVHVRRLREKIEADPSSPAHILTMWGVGYKFEP